MLKSMTGFGRAKYQVEGREYIQTAGSGRDAGRTGTEVRKK